MLIGKEKYQFEIPAVPDVASQVGGASILQMIAAIFHAEGKLKDMSPRDRQRKRKIKVLLLEGINNKKVQSDIALELQSELRGQGKNAALTVFDDNEETLTAENVQKTL